MHFRPRRRVLDRHDPDFDPDFDAGDGAAGDAEHRRGGDHTTDA